MVRVAHIIPKTPVTLLSGFLGAGKTTLLTRLLVNDRGMRIGVVVNDLAAVNVDAALVRAVSGKGAAEAVSTIELQNGCMCCSAADDLVLALSELAARAQASGVPFDHVVVEATGVADPSSSRDRLVSARDDGHPLFAAMELHTFVTVVDGSALPLLLEATGPVSAHPGLVGTTPATHADGALDTEPPLPPSADSAVVTILMAQAECADVIVINKRDLLRATAREEVFSSVGVSGSESAAEAAADAAESEALHLMRALNPRARILVTSHGRVEPDLILAAAPDADPARAVAHDFGAGGPMRVALTAGAEQFRALPPHPVADVPTSPGDEHALAMVDATGVPELGPSVGITHGVAGESLICVDCDGDEAGDAHGSQTVDRQVRSQARPHPLTTTSELPPFTAIVYSRRRPFDEARLRAHVLAHLPGAYGRRTSARAPVDGGALAESDQSRAARAALHGVVRSKGFVWLAHDPVQAYCWQHAGMGATLEATGFWTGDSSQGTRAQAGATTSAPTTSAVPTMGTRRQELVLVGSAAMSKERIFALLDTCLTQPLGPSRGHVNIGETADTNATPTFVHDDPTIAGGEASRDPDAAPQVVHAASM
mmetsp:Transcript_23320/g.63231  ORF Transcript_23320/g.63231 Transcript_23320/m.63231 type:complete len:600 (-) Transcript_23320:51-1850(-)